MAWCFSTRASVATVLTTHPCVSRCLRVKQNIRITCLSTKESGWQCPSSSKLFHSLTAQPYRLGLGKWTVSGCLKTVGISTVHMNPWCNRTRSNLNLYFDQPITQSWCQLIGGQVSNPTWPSYCHQVRTVLQSSPAARRPECHTLRFQVMYIISWSPGRNSASNRNIIMFASLLSSPRMGVFLHWNSGMNSILRGKMGHKYVHNCSP